MFAFRKGDEMVSVSIAAILAVASQLALWGLLLAFGIWAYRKLKLRSLPWLGVYLALSVVLSFGTPILKMHIFDAAASRHAADPFGWSLGQFAATWTYLEGFGVHLVKVIVAVLVLADIAFLLSKAGVDVEGKFLSRLLALREKTVPLGIAMIVLMVLGPGVGLTFYFHDEHDLGKAKEYVTQQRWDDAIEAYKKVLSKQDKHIRANEMLGRIYYRQGAYDQAIEYLNRVPPDVPWAALTLGWCYDALGERDQAIEAYRRTLGLNPQESIATAARLGVEAPHSPTKKVKVDEKVEDEELPTAGWKAVADPNDEDAPKAYDRDPKTKWASNSPQSPGMYYQLDMGDVRTVNRVMFDDDAGGTTIYVSDYPRQYDIEVSTDGESWKRVASEEGDLNYYAGAYFDPTEARYIKITQKGSTTPEWWSVCEIYVYTPKWGGPRLGRGDSIGESER